ncbi:hypothetical protein [Spirillospora sp. NPDC047279]|uniref:hypothetical protein n=1 Tax=Spirillospora sp. NPDC047279 TaxID=3155478 RepID=UPI0033C8EDC2
MANIDQRVFFNDLWEWFGQVAPTIEKARTLKGGGGFEQWAVIEFLRWQTAKRGPDLNYRREYTAAKGLKRRFDVAYNCPDVAPPGKDDPVMLTQWKCGNTANSVSMEIQKDIGTFSEALGTGLGTAPQPQLGSDYVEPFIIAFSPEPLISQSMWVGPAVAGTALLLQISTDATLAAYGISPKRV